MFKRMWRKKKNVKEEEGCVTLLKVAQRGSYVRRPEENARHLLGELASAPQPSQQQNIPTGDHHTVDKEPISIYEKAQHLPIIPEDKDNGIYSSVNYEYMDVPSAMNEQLGDAQNGKNTAEGGKSASEQENHIASHKQYKNKEGGDTVVDENSPNCKTKIEERRSEEYEEVQVPMKHNLNMEDDGIYSTVYETCRISESNISNNTTTDNNQDSETCDADDVIEPAYMTVNSQLIRPVSEPTHNVKSSDQASDCDRPLSDQEDVYAIVSKNRTASLSSSEITKNPLGEQDSLPGPPVPGKDKLQPRDSKVMVDNDMYGSTSSAAPAAASIPEEREESLSPSSKSESEGIYDEPYMKMETHAMKMNMLSMTDEYSSALISQESS